MIPDRQITPDEDNEVECYICEEYFDESEVKLIDTKKIYCHICEKCERNLDCSSSKKLEKKLEKLAKEKYVRIWSKKGNQWSFINKVKTNNE